MQANGIYLEITKKYSEKSFMNRGLRKMGVSSVLIPLIWAFAATASATAAEKVVVIVDGGDKDPRLAQYFINSAKEASEAYQGQGYEVIRVTAAQGVEAPEFRQILESKVGVKKLDVVFLSHGDVRAWNNSFAGGKALDPKEFRRFPISYLRDDELYTRFDPSGSTQNSLRFAFPMYKPDHGDFDKDSIGLGDLHDSLAQFKRKNPASVINVSATSCFGGNAIRALRDIPNVQFFSASPANMPADSSSSVTSTLNLLIQDLSSGAGDAPVRQTAIDTSYLRFFTKEIKSGSTYFDAHFAARKAYNAEKLKYLAVSPLLKTEQVDARDFLNTPVSSLELIFSDKCIGAPPRTEVARFCDTAQAPEGIKTLSAETAQPLVTALLSKEVDATEVYLNEVYDRFLCAPKQESELSELIKSALTPALDEAERRFMALSQTDIDQRKQEFERLLAHVDEAKSTADLLRELQNLGAPPNRYFNAQVRFEPAKRVYTNVIQGKLDLLKKPGSLDAYRAKTKERFLQAREPGNFTKCMSEPLKCRVEALDILTTGVNDWEGREETINLKSPTLKTHRDAKLLLVKKCQIEKPKEQLACILAETEKDPLLRLFTLLQSFPAMDSMDREQSCARIRIAKANNQKLKGCLSKPGSVGDAEFWSQMTSLYTQGLSGLK